MTFFAFFITLMLLATPAFADSGYVILLHGHSRSPHLMEKMQRDLAANGFKVLNLDYPSRAYDIRNLVELIWPQIDSFVKNKSKPVSFVGHSMGGLIARAYVTAYPPQHMGRMVLLGVPNHGSEVADLL